MWNRIFSSLAESSVYLKRNEGIALLLGVIVLACALYLLGHKRRRNLPPGPIGLPVFGYYFFLGKKPEKTLCEVGRKYGNVFGFYLGPQYMVFLHDWEAMKDALGQSATLDRPPEAFTKVPYKFGVGGANGAEWVQIRRLTSRAIKDVGLHGTRWEELIQEEVSELVKRIVLEGERPIEVRSFFCESFANSVVTLILGERLPAGHPITKFVAESVDAILEFTPTLGMSNFSPTLARILQVVGLEKNFQLHKKVHEFAEFVSKTVDTKIRNPMSEDSFLAQFYQEVENHRKTTEETYITEDTLKGNVIALLTGGSETSRTTIIWTLIAMAENPDKQTKVHEELDRVIGKEGSIRWSDRFKIPYTYASLMESMRWGTVVPFSTLRITTEDMQVQGYHIPKGTFLSANTWSIHNDPRYWDNPDQFIPERFLLDDGKKVNTAPESFNPFSYGKRDCPGKLIAYMELLQYFTVLMQNFKVMPKEGNKVKYDTHLGIIYKATNVELRFIRR